VVTASTDENSNFTYNKGFVADITISALRTRVLPTGKSFTVTIEFRTICSYTLTCSSSSNWLNKPVV